MIIMVTYDHMTIQLMNIFGLMRCLYYNDNDMDFHYGQILI